MQVQTLSRFVPITGWLPGCSWKTTRGDIVVGIAVAGLLIPEGMAYAGIAGAPQVGLYAAMLGMVVYAIFGTSRQLAVTSTSSSAAMLAALVAPLALTDAGRYVVLMSAATNRSRGNFPAGWLAKARGGIGVYLQTRAKGVCFWFWAYDHGQASLQTHGNSWRQGKLLLPVYGVWFPPWRM